MGIFGSVADRADGQGLLIRGELQQLRAGGNGTLTKLTMSINDFVKDRQSVGYIQQIDNSEETKTARQQLDQAERYYEISKIEENETIDGIRRTITGLEADKRSTQLLLERSKRDVALLQQSLKDGLVTRSIGPSGTRRASTRA